jgi:hypothetical protein
VTLTGRNEPCPAAGSAREDLSITSTEEAAVPDIVPQPWPDRSKPFPPGNQVSLMSGAHSPARVGELAEQIATALLEAPSTPEYVKDPSYAAAVMAYARSQAVAELLWRWLEAQKPEVLMADVTVTNETETPEGKGLRRKTITRRVESVLSQLHRAETRAGTLRARLGLDPLSRARLGKDITAAKADLAQLMAQIAKADQARDADGP